MITSAANPKIRLLRSLHERKHRRVHRLCLVEGVRLVEEALASPSAVAPVLYAPERLSSTALGRQLRVRLERNSEAEQIDEHLLDLVTDTVTSQGVVAAVQIPPPAAIPEHGLVLILDGLADPGNAGTILRTARAAGVAGVVAAQSTTDLWSPKAVRAGMGAHFHLNLAVDVPWREMPLAIGSRQVWIATSHGGSPYWEIDWTHPLALVLGSEAHGATPTGALTASGQLTIPMAEGVESLNAAAAAAILLFAARGTRL